MFLKIGNAANGRQRVLSPPAVRAHPPLRPDETRLSRLQPRCSGPASPRWRRGRGRCRRGRGWAPPVALRHRPEDPASLPSHPPLAVFAPPLPQDEIGLHLWDGGDTVGEEWRSSPSPKTSRRLREPITASAQPPTAPGLCPAAGSPLPQHPCLPVSPCAPVLPTGCFLPSHTTPLPDRLRQRSTCRTHPAGETAGLRDSGRPAAAVFLPSIRLADTTEPPIRIRRSGSSQSVPAGK